MTNEQLQNINDTINLIRVRHEKVERRLSKLRHRFLSMGLIAHEDRGNLLAMMDSIREELQKRNAVELSDLSSRYDDGIPW